jgi:hypothetical protein
MMRALRLFGIAAVWLLSLCLNAWALAALYFDFSRAGWEWLPPAIYLAVLTVVLTILKPRVFRIVACLTGFVIEIFRKYVLYANASKNSGEVISASSYFGQPSAGFFFSSDFLTASFQSQSILSSSGFGPG